MAKADPPFANTDVAAAFDGQPALLALRAMVFDVARELTSVGEITESLKWGQPSYATKTGTPIRLGHSKMGAPAIFVHCQSSVISDFAAVFGQDFEIDGARAVHLDPDSIDAQDGPLRKLIASALTYRL